MGILSNESLYDNRNNLSKTSQISTGVAAYLHNQLQQEIGSEIIVYLHHDGTQIKSVGIN